MESKNDLFLSGQNTNTMSTGNPKEYTSTDAHEDSSKSTEENKSEESTTSSEESSKSQKLNAQGAMNIVGNGVVVANIVSNAGNIVNAASDITSAAVGAVASKAGEIIGEYSTKFVSLPMSIPTKITEYTQARIAKSKGDKDENGNEYDPVKVSIGDIMSKYTNPVESQFEEEEKEIEEKSKNKAIDKAKQKAQKFIESANKLIDKSNESINKIMKHAEEGIEWVQSNINKEIARSEKNIRDGLESGYQSVENDIDTFCKAEGEKIAVKLISQYNKLIEEQAKGIVDKKNKAESKAKIKANAAIQKAKLKVFAMLGL